MAEIDINSMEDFDKLLANLKSRRRLQEMIIQTMVAREIDTREAISERNDLSFEIYRLIRIRKALKTDEPKGYFKH